MSGRKRRNFGGSGDPHSSMEYFTKAQKKRKPIYGKKEINHRIGAVMSKQELDDYINHDKIECLDCGHSFTNLTLHIYYSHLLSKEDYCKRYGIPTKTPLSGLRVRNAISIRRKEEEIILTNDEKIIRNQRLKKIGSGKQKKINRIICPTCFIDRAGDGSTKHTNCENCKQNKRKKTLIKIEDKIKAQKIQLDCNSCGKTYYPKTYASINRANCGKKTYCSINCYRDSIKKIKTKHF